MSLKRRRPGHATVVAYLSLFIAVGTGGAYAANTIRSEDIVDGQVKNLDLGSSAVTSTKIGSREVGSSKLADGSVGGRAVLNASLGTADIGSIPTVSVTHSEAQPGDDGAALDFDQETFDASGMHSTGAFSKHRLTARVAGVYQVMATVIWALDDQGTRSLTLLKNDQENVAEDDQNARSSGFVYQNLATLVKLAAGDYLTVITDETSDESLDILGCPSFCPAFSMNWVGPG